MSVFNNETDLAEAIDSVLMQTFTDFEFIIINDASTDNSGKILDNYAQQDQRIRLINNEKNIKLAASLNRGIAVAKGEYIVRMDADDVALPDRFKQQYEFMQSNTQIAVSGTWVQVYEKAEIVWRTNISPEAANCAAFFESCFHHPTVIIRKSVLDEYGAYDDSIEYAQDCHLWSRLAFDHHLQLTNIPQVLLRYRSHPDKNRDEYRLAQHDKATTLRKKNLARLGIDINDDDYHWHDVLCRGKPLNTAQQFLDLINWIRYLENANQQQQLLSAVDFKHELEQKLLRVSLASAKNTLSAVTTYMHYCGGHDLVKNLYRSARMLKAYLLSSMTQSRVSHD